MYALFLLCFYSWELHTRSSTAPLVQFEFNCLAPLRFNREHLPFSWIEHTFFYLYAIYLYVNSAVFPALLQSAYRSPG